MVKISSRSHRQKLGLKYKIEKRVAEHKRKVRRAAKNPVVHRKFRKDPGVPNSWPFKSEVLQEIKDEQERKLAARKEKRRLTKLAQSGGDVEMKENRSLEEIGTAAQAAGEAFEKQQREAEVEEGQSVGGSMSRRAFAGVVDKVIKSSDVVVEVLDVRDPEGCRDKDLEEKVIQNGKKLVLLLNKIDLVPSVCVEKWIKYYSVRVPCAVFKAATTSDASRIVHCDGDPLKVGETQKAGTNQVLGAQQLVALLKNYCRSTSKSLKSITVGVVGFPNVGKSSVINSLLRAGATKTGGEAGVTRASQEVKLDKSITILDSPGIVMGGGEDSPAAVLRGAVKLSLLADPMPSVDELFRRCPLDVLMRHFAIKRPTTSEEFLGLVARKRGRLSRKGIPDLNAAGRVVLQEWIGGAIRYYLLPPVETLEEATIVTTS